MCVSILICIDYYSKGMSSDDRIITIDAGGQIFKCRQTTLCKYENTGLAVLFSPTSPFLMTQSSIFIDRSPVQFQKVLDFLRSGFYPEEDDKLGWHEFDYWNLPHKPAQPGLLDQYKFPLPLEKQELSKFVRDVTEAAKTQIVIQSDYTFAICFRLETDDRGLEAGVVMVSDSTYKLLKATVESFQTLENNWKKRKAMSKPFGMDDVMSSSLEGGRFNLFNMLLLIVSDLFPEVTFSKMFDDEDLTFTWDCSTYASDSLLKQAKHSLCEKL